MRSHCVPLRRTGVGTGGRLLVRCGGGAVRSAVGGAGRTFHYAKSNLKGTAEGTERSVLARLGGSVW